MSLGYAEKLSYREDLGGQLGAKELFDKPSDLRGKVHQLKDLVRAVWRPFMCSNTLINSLLS